MARKPLIRDAFFPYHVTNRTLGKRYYPIDIEKIWQLYTDHLCLVSWAYGAQIHAFVLMSNHYHLLISAPFLNLDEIVQAFQSQVSLTLSKEINSKDWCFDTRYKWTLINERAYFYNTYKYIYQNPIRAGLANKISDYKYSTIHGKAGYSKLTIPLWTHPLQDDLGISDIHEEERWLDYKLDSTQLDLIRKGLRRCNFSLSNRDRHKLKLDMSKR